MQAKSFGNIVIFGDVGKGKTSLCNTILGREVGKVASVKCAGGVIDDRILYNGRWREKGPQITVFDMPGFGGTSKKTLSVVDEWRNMLESKVFTAVCFVVRVDDHRFTTSQELALKIFEICVQNSYPWGSIIFIGTHVDKLDDDEGSPEERLNDVIKEANKMIKKEGAIHRKVWISLKQNKVDELNFGLKQLEGHLLDLLGKGIKVKEKLPPPKEVEALAKEAVYGKSGGEDNCFDGEMNVKVFKSGKIKSAKLTEVELLDLIQVNDGSFEPVMILSRHISKPVPVLHFEMENKEKGKKLELRLVSSHFMYIMREKKILHIPARKVEINDELLHFSEDGTVIQMRITNITIKTAVDTVNVRTKSRTVIVNDVYCSSVVEGDAGTVGHYIALACGKVHEKLPNEANKLIVSLNSIYRKIKNL